MFRLLLHLVLCTATLAGPIFGDAPIASAQSAAAASVSATQLFVRAGEAHVKAARSFHRAGMTVRRDQELNAAESAFVRARNATKHAMARRLREQLRSERVALEISIEDVRFFETDAERHSVSAAVLEDTAVELSQASQGQPSRRDLRIARRRARRHR